MPCTYDAADVGTEADTPARSDDGTTMEQRRPSFAAPNSAAKQDKLPQQSAPDTANFLEFACNVSSVFSPPTFNTSNVRGNAELSEIPWLLYDFVQFLFGVLLPFVYGILKRCGARVLFEMLISTHIDIAVPLVSILFSAMGAIIFVGEDNVRKRRRRETPLVNVLMIGIDVGLTMAWWVSLPFLFLAFPFVIVWRLLVVMWRIICIVDRIAYALGMLLGGLALIVYGGLRRIAIDGFYLVLRVFGVPYNDLDVAAHVYMMTASSDSDWDARKYPMSRPYWGKRGVDFENFVRDFGAALAGKGDDDASLEETMYGLDPGGNTAAAPPAIAGMAAARRRTKRLRELYSILYRHVPEPRLREMMHANAANDGRAAFELLEANCRQVIDDLELLQMDADWTAASILNTVGFSMDSITLFSRHLNGLNALRPFGNRKTEDELTTKFLACIDTNIEATMGADAKKELRAQGALRQFVNAAGGRDYQGCVTFFDDMWRSHFRSGSIRARPRQSGSVDRSARADANVVGEDDEALIVNGARRPPVDRQKMGTETICWNCRGFGHVADDCPSAKGFRAISDAVHLLGNMVPRGKGAFGRGGGGRGGAGRAGSWRRPMRRFGNAKVVLDQGLVFDDDGNIFDADGAFVGTVEAQTAEAPPSGDNNDAGPSEPPTTEAADVVSDLRFNDADADDEWVGDMYVVSDDATGDATIPPPPDYWAMALANLPVLHILDSGCTHHTSVPSRFISSASTANSSRDLAGEMTAIAAGVSEEEIQAQRELLADFDFTRPWQAPYDDCHHDYVCRGYCDDLDCDGYIWRCDECGDWYCDGCCERHGTGQAPVLAPTPSSSSAPSEADFEDTTLESGDLAADLYTTPARFHAGSRAVPASFQGGSFAGSAVCCLLALCCALISSAFASLSAFARGSLTSFRFSAKVFIALTFGLLLGLQRDLDLSVRLCGLVLAAPLCSSATVVPLYVASDAFTVGKINTTRGCSWIVDCGATKHCTPAESDCCEITDPNPNCQVRVGNGKVLKVTAIGKVRLTMPTQVTIKRKGKTKVESGSEVMELSNVYVVPEMHCRLFSSEWAWRHDGISTHLNDDCYLRLPSGSKVLFSKNSTDGHYRVASLFVASSELSPDECELLHAGLAHFSAARIDLAKHQGYSGLDGYRHDPLRCPACLANRRKKSVPRTSQSGRVFTFFGQCVCSDICGPFPESPQGFVYACNFYDKFSHHAAVYFMKNKSSEEIRRCHDTYLSDHKQWLKDGKIHEWVVDDGQNFHARELDQMCVDLSTRRSFAIPHVSEKHGAAERLWGILLGPAKRVTFHAGNDTGKEGLWPFVLTHVCLVHNALPTASLSPPSSPHEMVTKQKPDLKIFKGKVPLSDCWVNTNNPKDKPVNKLSPNNVKAVYLCYDARRRGDFVYIPELQRITTCFHVTHCPREFTLLGESVTVRKYKERGDLPTSIGHENSTFGPQNFALPPVRDLMGNPAVPPPAQIADVDVVGGTFASHDDAFLVSWGANACVVSPNAVEPVRIPTGYHDAVNDPVYGEKWKEACDSEHRGKFVTNQSWVHVHLPGNRTLTKSKWVFKVEYAADGSVKRFKARIVACGYSQIGGLDYDWDSIYAPTLSSDSMRTFLFCGNENGDEFSEADVVKAFTHAELDEQIYMAPPEGYAPRDGKVCLLRKGVEGLKQGANGFMKLNATVMDSLGLKRSMLDPNVFTLTKDGTSLRVGVYVDNLLCAHTKGEKGRAMCAEFFKAYGQKINLEIRGPPKAFMGVQIEHDVGKGTLFLHQKQYIEKAFDKFCDKSTKLFTTPVQTSACDAFTKLRAAETDEERMQMSDKPYLALMGSILWAIVMTRPDCAFYAGFLCQFMSDPTIDCWYAAIALLSYMYNTRTLGLLYKRCGHVRLSVYCDSSYGASPKPMYGYVVFANGTPVSWSAKKQKIVPQSSCEAETYALNAGCRALIFIKNLLAELNTTVELPMATHTDNDAARLTAINPGTTARTKHFESWLRYVRELYLNLVITVNWVPTKEQIADLFTKPLDKTTFLYLRSLLMTEQR